MAFQKSIIIAASLLLSSLVSAVPVDRATALVERKQAPADWWVGWESYDAYHARYKALDCKSQHNTPFFTDCCGPLKNDQALSTRPDQCDPSKAVAAPVPELKTAPEVQTTDVGGEDDDDDDDEDCTEDVTESVTSAPVPAPVTSAPVSDEFTGGFGTYFFQHGNAGACGHYNTEDALIAAIDFRKWGMPDFSQGSPQCGRKALVTNVNNGKQVEVTIDDVCPTCENENSLDLSEGAFKALADPSEGMIPLKWHFIS